MNFLDALILGLVQGLTEFLPVSSSGHLVMAQTFLGVPAQGVVLEVTLHIATLLSVVVVYRARLLSLAAGAVARDPTAWRYIGMLAVATVPAGLVGLLFEDAIESAFDTPVVTGVMLLVTGALLWSTRWAPAQRDRLEPGFRLAFAMGVAQAFAIMPGISRSGTTIATGLWRRLDGEKAAEFSFLMSLPAIAGAGLLKALEMGQAARSADSMALAIAFVTALLSGILAIKALVWLVRRQEFHFFSPYLWIAGAGFLAYIWMV